jgi:DNA-binding MarR family transcriptional regulator
MGYPEHMPARHRYDGPLTTHLGFWLRFVSNHVSGAFRQKLATKGVAVAEWALLRELYEGDLPPSGLAVRLGMTRGGVTKLADKLEARGLVARAAHDHDLRRQTLSLTPAGRRLVPQLAALADRNETEFFGHLPAATVQQLTGQLRALVEHHRLRQVPVS